MMLIASDRVPGPDAIRRPPRVLSLDPADPHHEIGDEVASVTRPREFVGPSTSYVEFLPDSRPLCGARSG